MTKLYHRVFSFLPIKQSREKPLLINGPNDKDTMYHVCKYATTSGLKGINDPIYQFYMGY